MLSVPVLNLLRRQRGVLGDHQLQQIEPLKPVRRRIHRHPEIERVSPRVLRHRVVPPSVEQLLMAAVLDAGRGGALWAESAASHWGFSRYPRLPAHVAVSRRTVDGTHLGHLHVVRSLDPRDVTTHLDIPVSRPERTVLWLARKYTCRYGHEIAVERTARVVDQAWRQRLIDGTAIHALAERAGGKGNAGIVVLRAVLEQRPPDYQPAGSALEERFEAIVSADVRAALDRQVTVDAEVVVRTVDFRLRTWPLIVEINGEAFHSSFTDRAGDAERYERLLSMGWSVAVFWEYDVWHDRHVVRAAMDRLASNPDPRPTLHRPTRAPWEL